MLSKKHINNERTAIIQIKQPISPSLSPKGEYSLKQNFFDPTKSSPPNNFMSKLSMRMEIYNKNFYTDISEDNFDKE